MKIAIGLLACAALVSFVATGQAQTAAPKIKGKYTYSSVEICQNGITTVKDGQGDVIHINPVGSNHMAAVVATATFTGAAANSGQVNFSEKRIEGLPLYITGSPAAVLALTTGSGIGAAYSNTATELNLAGDVGVVGYGNIVSGIAKTVNFMFRRTGNRCFESGTMTRVN